MDKRTGLMVVALVVVLSYMVYIGWNSQDFRIDVANISGLHNITSRDVNSVYQVPHRLQWSPSRPLSQLSGKVRSLKFMA